MMGARRNTILLVCCLGLASLACATNYNIDVSTGNVTYTGIGAISGGGATSKLLFNYPETYKREVLDFLFKPDFGASLDIIKVEIGGDAQSTEGTEASHWRNEWETPNFHRGYEWDMLAAAKARNPKIKVYAIPWTWPAFLRAPGGTDPYHNNTLTAQYVVSWIEGAKSVHNIETDYVGIWNERAYNNDYIITLRAALNDAGFENIKIVAGDDLEGRWAIVDTIKSNSKVAAAVDIVGAHYPGTDSPSDAKALPQPLWSSEDMSTTDDEVGNGCWARILNQNWVNGRMSTTICWNIVTAYYEDLPYPDTSLMKANEPWSGHYEVNPNIWIAAHTTQFAKPGYLYAEEGYGHFDNGGSYLTFVDKAGNPDDITIVIETMTHEHSKCVRPKLPKYDVTPQNVTFTLTGCGKKCPEYLKGRFTQVYGGSGDDDVFQQIDKIKVVNGQFSLSLGLDQLWTLSSTKSGTKGSYKKSPNSAPFPVDYSDSFDNQPVESEPFNFVPQVGAAEIYEDSDYNRFVRQPVLEPPIKWCNQGVGTTIVVGGNTNQSHATLSMSVRWPEVNATKELYIVQWVRNGLGCYTIKAHGIFFFVNSNGKFRITEDLNGKLPMGSGKLASKPEVNKWYDISIATFYLNDEHTSITASFDNAPVWNGTARTKSGFYGWGTGEYALGDFDNLKIKAPNDGGELLN